VSKIAWQKARPIELPLLDYPVVSGFDVLFLSVDGVLTGTLGKVREGEKLSDR
jgi:hypothetical protein